MLYSILSFGQVPIIYHFAGRAFEGEEKKKSNKLKWKILALSLRKLSIQLKVEEKSAFFPVPLNLKG